MKILKKIIRFPWVVCLAFWEVLKYIWANKTRLLVPFLLGEFTYWLPVAGVGILSWLWENPLWIASFWGFYVGVLPAIPIQILLTFMYYALWLKLKNKENGGLKAEAQALITKIKSIT